MGTSSASGEQTSGSCVQEMPYEYNKVNEVKCNRSFVVTVQRRALNNHLCVLSDSLSHDPKLQAYIMCNIGVHSGTPLRNVLSVDSWQCRKFLLPHCFWTGLGLEFYKAKDLKLVLLP